MKLHDAAETAPRYLVDRQNGLGADLEIGAAPDDARLDRPDCLNARGSRNRDRSFSKSRHTDWKMSDASSYNPSLMGIEKIKFLYLSTSAAQAC